jgi:transposase-like protein
MVERQAGGRLEDGWVAEASGARGPQTGDREAVEVREPKPRRHFTAEQKLAILEQIDDCSEVGQIGAILRREGLYSALVSKWRQQRQRGVLAGLAAQAPGRKPVVDPLKQQVEKLERENARLRLQLKHAALIIDVQKKVAQLMGHPIEPLPDSGADDV